jgi:hypothetical protein
MRIGLHVLCFVILASVAAAQSSNPPFPDAVNVNGGWVPCSHPIAINAGKGCGSTTPAPTPAPTPAAPPDGSNLPQACIPLPSPYDEPERFTLCRAGTDNAVPNRPTFRVRTIYNDPYGRKRIIVLGIARSIEDTEVITAQWLTDGGEAHRKGDVFAFRTSDGFAGLWRELIP